MSTTRADPGRQAERRAQDLEIRGSLQPALAGCAVIVLLVALADWRSGAASCQRAVLGSSSCRLTNPDAHATAWADGVLVLVVLLVGLQLIGLLLVHEHHTNPQSGWRYRAGVIALFGIRALLFGVVALAVWLPFQPVSIVAARNWAAAAEAATLVLWALLAAVLWRLLPLAPLPDGPPRDDDRPTDRAGVGDGDRLVAIGASGGGIRAAAFALGGHQAAQEQRDALHVSNARDEPHVFAVSGGSYMAAALALRRGFALDGSRRDPATPWATTYSPSSPELRRLRRNTRYLYEPGGRVTDGVLTLLFGAAITLFLVGVALRYAVWLGTQLSVLLGVVRPTTRLNSDAFALSLSRPEVLSSWHEPAVLFVPGVGVLLLVVLTVVGYWASSRLDGSTGSSVAARFWTRSAQVVLDLGARWRSRILVGALVWVVVTFALPVTSTVIARAALDNQPTAQVASVVRALGLVDSQLCRLTFEEQRTSKQRELDGAVARRTATASRTPVSVHGGACGSQFTMTSDSGSPETVSGDQEFRGRLLGVGTLLTLVAGLLRRGTSGVPSRATRFVGLRRRLRMWLPLGLMGVLAAYLSLLWCGGFLMQMSPDHSYLVTTVITTCAACAIAFLVDANVTSMHGFYRTSLATAFAVGVRGDDAEQLPPATVYGFSGLDGEHTPRLHIVTTLNTQAAGEAPTLRRGIPVVFSPDDVAVFGPGPTQRRAMGDFERFAGPGRVSIMATVGMSGAAVSPLMGRFNEQMAPYRLLLALFNLRLGTWVRNPAHTAAGGRTLHHDGRAGRWLWLTEKPGLMQMVLEAVGRSSAERRWVYLSDGGHLDNTGLVECVRHARRGPADRTGRFGRILVMDASNDPVSSWAAVGDAIAVVYADLGIELAQQELPGRPPWAHLYRGGGVDVLAVKAVRVDEPPPDARPDPDWWSELPANVQTFQAGHPDFPRASTARQKFGDLEFEAYRALGHRAAVLGLEAAGWTAPVPPPGPAQPRSSSSVRSTPTSARSWASWLTTSRAPR